MAIYTNEEKYNRIAPKKIEYDELNIHYDDTNPPVDTTKLWVLKNGVTKTYINSDYTLVANQVNISTSSETENGKLVALVNDTNYVYTTYVSGAEDSSGVVVAKYYDTTTEDWEEI